MARIHAGMPAGMRQWTLWLYICRKLIDFIFAIAMFMTPMLLRRRLLAALHRKRCLGTAADPRFIRMLVAFQATTLANQFLQSSQCEAPCSLEWPMPCHPCTKNVSESMGKTAQPQSSVFCSTRSRSEIQTCMYQGPAKDPALQVRLELTTCGNAIVFAVRIRLHGH